jgi:predicted enzyme related to lactoylglutathione lyase
MTSAPLPSVMPRGLTTVAYSATDHSAAKAWYAQVVGVAPYMDKPGYAEFRFGDYQHELGIIDAAFIDRLGGKMERGVPGGAIVYWHVDDIDGALDRLITLGAKPFHPPRDFGDGFVGAAVLDPFGNIFGVMNNPHYLEVLGKFKAADSG